jgi:Spy/CpxP family protein refolding chaperone
MASVIMTRARFASWLSLLAVLTLAAPSLAERGPHRRGPPPDRSAEAYPRIKEIRNRVLREHVGLDAARAQQVEAVLDKYHAERRLARQEIATQQREIRRLLDQNSEDQAAYAKALTAAEAARQRLHVIDRAQHAELAKILTPKQHAKLEAAVRRMQRKLHRAMYRDQPDDEASD